MGVGFRSGSLILCYSRYTGFCPYLVHAVGVSRMTPPGFHKARRVGRW